MSLQAAIEQSRQPQIGNLERPRVVDEAVLRLQVPMDERWLQPMQERDPARQIGSLPKTPREAQRREECDPRVRPAVLRRS